MGAGRREMRIGYWTYGYEQTPPEEALPRLAAIGYRGIELCTQPNCSTPIETLDDRRVAAIKRLLGEHRLQTAPVDAHWGLVAPTPAAWEARLARFRRSIEVAAALGAPIVELSAGAAPPGWERARAWDALLEGAGEVAALAEAHGITLALEAHVGTVVERPDEAVALLRQVDRRALRLNLDLVHPYVLGYDLPAIVALLAPHTVFAHVSDGRGRYPNHLFLVPGEGDIDWAGYLRVLRRAGYGGYLMVQIPGMRRQRPGYNPLAAARLAYATLAAAVAGQPLPAPGEGGGERRVG